MSNTQRAALAFCLAAFLGACAQQEEPVYVTEPVAPPPTYTGKYK